ncbi:MAG: MFS transporter [Methanobacterium sp. ERen5]|nr:MAG: MFS transporter [Methanobacterium sp. ERen5]
MGYLVCSKCKSYYKLLSNESPKDFTDECDCGGKLRYIENLDIVNPNWKQVTFRKKPTLKERWNKKSKSLFSLPKINLKNRLNQFYYNYIGRHIYKARNQHRVHRNPGMKAGFLNSLMNEFHLDNIQWSLIIPMTIAITMILAFTHGIFLLLTFALLVIMGYLSENMIVGAKNAVITGAISFFLGSLFTGSFLLIIPYAILGIINGAVCGLVGGYVKTKGFR